MGSLYMDFMSVSLIILPFSRPRKEQKVSVLLVLRSTKYNCSCIDSSSHSLFCGRPHAGPGGCDLKEAMAHGEEPTQEQVL